MTLLKLVKQIASDVEGIKADVTNINTRLDNIVKLNNLKE
jgi:hypothetical protein